MPANYSKCARFLYLVLIVMACPLRSPAGQRRLAIMETLARRTPIKSSSLAESIDWPIITFWLTYLSLVFGILCAFISEGL